ncbi:hypothetical protein MYAM1_002248 [Malassezia yamatoensis]|uniref:Uncharacterized protein n=1 Tax=Malassezia yamatoensis TaxID=253288 RepID=A0AAJ5YUH5_9BASI|nr:hypothetical protein MYAM1_002248 [Malassezia yamatoensis]
MSVDYPVDTTGETDAVLRRMLLAFSMSPKLTQGAAESDSQSLSDVADQASDGEEEEWCADPESHTETESYVIHRPFDFAAFRSALPPAAPAKSPARQLSGKRSLSTRYTKTTDGLQAPTSSSQLIRRLSRTRSRRSPKRQVQLRHFRRNVVGLLQGHLGPIDSGPIGPHTEPRGAAKLAHAPTDLDCSEHRDTMRHSPLERPTTPLCTQIVRSQSLRSTPVRRKPVPRVISHNRAESDPTNYQVRSGNPPTPPPKEQQYWYARGGETPSPPPRPPKSLLRKASIAFQPPYSMADTTPSRASRLCRTLTYHSRTFSNHSEAYASEAPPLVSDHSDTEETESVPDFAPNRIQLPNYALPTSLPASKHFPPFLGPAVSISM